MKCASIFVAFTALIMPLQAIAEKIETPPAANFIEGYPPRLAARIAAYEATLKQAGVLDSAATKGTFVAPFVWPPTIKRIIVCFMPSYKLQRQIVTAFALEWTRYDAHIPLDFGDPNDPRICGDSTLAHIRINLNDKNKHHSAIGVLSYKLVPQSQPSMEIGIIDGKKRKMLPAC